MRNKKKNKISRVVMILALSIFAINCGEVPEDITNELKKQKPTKVKAGLKDIAKQKVDFEKKKMKKKFDICYQNFKTGSSERQMCNKVLSWVTGSVTGHSSSGILIAFGGFFGILFLGFMPFYRVGNRYRRYKKFSRDFRYFMKHNMSYAQSHGRTGEFSKDVKRNMETSFRDFFIPGERRHFFVEVTKKGEGGNDETVKIKSKRTYPTMDMAPLRMIMYSISQNIRHWYKLLRFIPFAGGSAMAAMRDSDKQDMLEKDIENSDSFHFYYKPFKKEFKEYYNGNIWKQPGEVDDPKDRLDQ